MVLPMKIMRFINGNRVPVTEQQAAVFQTLGLGVIEDRVVVKKPLPISDDDGRIQEEIVDRYCEQCGERITGQIESHNCKHTETIATRSIRQKRKYRRRDMKAED